MTSPNHAGGTARDRLIVIGLEGADPDLVFGGLRDDLPHLRRLMERGIWGRLEACHPPLSTLAWPSMMTGRDPGELGIYGPRNKLERTYGHLAEATSQDVSTERLWQSLSSGGRRCAVLWEPSTYPPSPLNGVMVAPAPPGGRPSCFPEEMEAELERAGLPLRAEQIAATGEDPAGFLREIQARTSVRFQTARHLLARESWDLLLLVDDAIESLQGRFWRYFDRDHRLYRPGSLFQSAVHDHYVQVDAEVGKTLEAAGDASVLVVSDHGARSLLGAVRINEWLLREGYLKLLPPPPAGEVSPQDVDWRETLVWADGGPCARLFFNVEGREPEGRLPRSRYEPFRDEVAARLEAMEDHLGRPMGTRVERPDRIYRALRGVPPDLQVYFGDLAWRSLATLGGGEVLALGEEEAGTDVNNGRQGIFIYSGPEVALAAQAREERGVSVYDIAPSLRRKFHLPVPADLRGRPFF
jgi:predicted AlkP superfamily phosphohydrolase/phosphomutase